LDVAEGWDFVKELWDKLMVAEFAEAMSVARLLWMRRNKWVFDGIFSSPSQVLIQTNIEDYVLAYTTVNQDARGIAGSQPKWTKPLHGELKCNWDAALNAS